MLSWSAQNMGIAWDPRSITDPSVDPLLAGGRELVGFVDAAHGSEDDVLASARAELRAALGDAATVEAAAVLGNLPVGPGSMRHSEQLRAATGIKRFHAHTP